MRFPMTSERGRPIDRYFGAAHRNISPPLSLRMIMRVIFNTIFPPSSHRTQQRTTPPRHLASCRNVARLQAVGSASSAALLLTLTLGLEKTKPPLHLVVFFVHRICVIHLRSALFITRG